MLLSVKIMLQMITVFFGNCGNFAPSEKIALQIFSRENLRLTDYAIANNDDYLTLYANN